MRRRYGCRLDLQRRHASGRLRRRLDEQHPLRAQQVRMSVRAQGKGARQRTRTGLVTCHRRRLGGPAAWKCLSQMVMRMHEAHHTPGLRSTTCYPTESLITSPAASARTSAFLCEHANQSVVFAATKDMHDMQNRYPALCGKSQWRAEC